jgi:septum site-determining protein MinC
MTKKNNLIQMKADLMPLTILQLNSSNISDIQLQLNNKIKQAPQYFTHAPMIIDVNTISDKNELNLTELCETLKSCKIIPVGIKGLEKKHQQNAINHGLAIINSKTEKVIEKDEITSNNKTKSVSRPYKLISKPIRSGTQVYAKDRDLIILSSVNTGAEVIADGNIHIYGPLRGRALAGARGDTEARIFCERCDAELISIAGHYLVKENIKLPRTKKPLFQIYLNNETITIEGI